MEVIFIGEAPRPLLRRHCSEEASHLRSLQVTLEHSEPNGLGQENQMKRVFSAGAAALTIVAAVTWATGPILQSKAPQSKALQSNAQPSRKEIVAFTADQVRWFTPPYYNDGRQRAHLFGDSSKGGAWIDRVKIPGGARVLAHTHPQDELVTVIEGTWYLGEGAKFDAAKLKGYPARSFIVIPAGVPHFVAAKESAVVVQLSGIGKFQTDYLEK